MAVGQLRFIAIGIRHYDIARAQTELTSLLRGLMDQWHIAEHDL